MKKIFFVVIAVLLMGVLSSCTEKEEEVIITDTYFYDLSNQIDDELDFDSSWANVLDKLELYISPPYTEQPNLYKVWNFDLDVTDEADYDDYKKYKTDLEDPDIFEYNYSILTLLGHYIGNIDTLIEDQSVVSGTTINFEKTNIESTYQMGDGSSDYILNEVEITSNYTMLVHLGLDFMYFEFDQYTSNDLVDSSIFYISYNDTDITEYKMYEKKIITNEDSEASEHTFIDYTLGEASVYANVTGNESVDTFELAIFDEFGSSDTISYDGYSPDQVSVDMDNELFFWSILMDDTDFRNLSLYQDGVFQLEHRMLYHTDTNTFQESNNTITYNAKYVDGWEYYLGGTGTTSFNGEEYPTYRILSGDNIQLHMTEPNYVLTVEQDIDAFITEDNYTNIEFEYGDTHYTYQKVPYSTFINYWDSYENVWDDFSMTESTFTFKDETYSIETPESFISTFAGTNFAEFILSLENKTLPLDEIQ